MDSYVDFHHGCPITSTIRTIPSEVLLTPAEDGVLDLYAVNLDNVQTMMHP